MNLGTHRSRTAERSATGADTEGCAPLDTTATSHGGDKEPCPGLQKSEWDSNLRMTLALIKSDSYKGLKQTAALRSILTQCPSETPTRTTYHEQLSISN